MGDSASGPDLVSPAIYREFSMPYEKRLGDTLKAEGVQTVCHICGRLDPILEDVVETGFAGYEVDYRTNIQLAKKVFKGRATLFGNIDPSGVFCLSSSQKVRETAIRLLEVYKEGGRFVIGAGCALPKETPEENIRAFVDAVREYGQY